MAYEEYDYYNEPAGDSKSLKESLREILYGLQDRTKLREAGTSLKEALQLTPNVSESLARGGVGQAIGTSGDLREIRNTINSYLPKSVRNFTQAAEFLANPYATAIQQTAPTTEQVLETVPRATDKYEGYRQHETLGEFVAPSLGYFGAKAIKAGKDLPIGLTMQDVNKTPLTPKEAEILTSQIDELGFHSALENAAIGIKQPKGTGEQFLKQLEKTPGVKTEELEVIGLKQYLQNNKFVTKQEVQDFLQNNRVKLENKILNESTAPDEADYALQSGDVYHDDDYIRGLADDLHYDMKNDDVIRSQEREALLEADPERYADYETNSYSQARLEEDIDGVLYENAKQQANDMYYENPIRHYYDEHGYDIYGSDDMGYTVRNPNGRIIELGGRNGLYDISDVEAELRMHHLDEGNLDVHENGVKYADYVLPGRQENYREILITHDPTPAIVEDIGGGFWAAKDQPNAEPGIGKSREEAISNWKHSPSRKKYESSHFDESNILAHMRVNDRTINGKKTLMVEEIQSDWHQTGRKKGYDTPEVRQNIAKERQRLLDEKDHFEELAKPYTDLGQDAPPDIVDGWTKAANGLQELQKIENSMRSAVPNAPFKKNWHEMMVKQALDMAVKGDYDAIAFTTGKQQADRYSLSKQINELRAEKLLSGTKEGQYIITATNKNGNPSVSKIVTEQELENLLGKDLAKKIVEDSPDNPDGKTYSGLDLDVGGEGMKGFYDKILPDFVNKYTKKWGMGVRKANTLPSLQGEQVHMVDLTDAAKKDIKEKGQPLFSGIGLAAPALMPEDQDKTKK